MEKSEFRQAQSTFSTDFLFLAYNNESTFHQQLHNVAKMPLNYVETCPNIAQMQPHDPAFVIGCEQTRTHLADSFLMPKHSCKIYHTRPTEMFTVSLISRTFNRRSLSTISWILSIISWEVTSFGRPGHPASLVLIRPQRNSWTTYELIDLLNSPRNWCGTKRAQTFLLPKSPVNIV